MKKLFHVAFVVALLASAGCDEEDSGDLKKNGIFEITQDVYLYCYCGKYQLVRPRFAQFTMDQFRRDPSIGVIDKSANVRYVAIVPKGTRVKYTGDGKYFHWANGGWQHYPYGRILDDRFSRYRKVAFAHLFGGSPGDNGGEFARVITPTPNEASRVQAGDPAGGAPDSSQ